MPVTCAWVTEPWASTNATPAVTSTPRASNVRPESLTVVGGSGVPTAARMSPVPPRRLGCAAARMPPFLGFGSTIVLSAPAPLIVRFLSIVSALLPGLPFPSTNVPAQTLIVSPGSAASIAFWIFRKSAPGHVFCGPTVHVDASAVDVKASAAVPTANAVASFQTILHPPRVWAWADDTPARRSGGGGLRVDDDVLHVRLRLADVVLQPAGQLVRLGQAHAGRDGDGHEHDEAADGVQQPQFERR